MKLYTLTRRFTAAVLTAAMALSFCAPALAEAPGTAADPAAPAASAPAANASSCSAPDTQTTRAPLSSST